MPTLVGMATTTAGNQPFSRLVESRKTTSWSIGIPIAVVVVIAVALLAYFASKSMQAREQLAQAQQALQQQQQQLTQVQQRIGQLETELNRLRDPGRTTVILQSAGGGKAASAAWGAATWGEQPDGKSWMRLNAYGLQPAPSGKAYQFWFVSAAGNSILVGKLDANSEGSAYAEGKDLPGVDQGKSVLVSLDDENAKTHSQPLFQAQLPKLTPSQHAAPPAAQSQGGTQAEQGAQGQAAGEKQPAQPAQQK
jgi:anti-sigma-K factor RskA